MSESSSDFDRSKLASKDREQLVVIATSLGKKPPSRAKKADIVDLIIELTGAHRHDAAADDGESADVAAVEARPDTGGSGTSDDGAAPDGDDAPTPVRTQRGGGRNSRPASVSAQDHNEQVGTSDDTPSGNGSGTTAGNGSNGGSSSARTSNGRESSKSDSDRSGDSANSGRNGGGNAQRNAGNAGGNAGQPRGGRSDSGQRDTSSGQSSQGGSNDRDDEHHDGSDGDGNQSGQSDSSNRRRRRRGRDRGAPQVDAPFEGEPVEVEGILDLRDDGYGFLRLRGYLPHRDDSYVSVKQVRQFGLRRGDHLKGQSRPPTRSEKNPALLRIDEVNGAEPSLARDRPKFEELTPLYPDEQLRLEHPDTIVDMTPRIIDLVAPIGKGQRGLIVSPPKAGKTTIMKTIARAIEQNNPEVHLMVLLIDERPEEVTDFTRWVRDGEVIASTFDRPSDEHTAIAELTIERAKRIVEAGGDVVILVDGITRLARAHNMTVPASGRIMSGGIDAAALYPPKRFFGAARNVEEGGSLTILATALVDTNSRMDDHIFEEFKGTGNMELRLDRRLAEQRIFPAIDIDGSSTRHEELLFTKPQLAQVWKLRRVLSGVGGSGGGTNAAALDLLVERMQAFKSNADFLAEVAKSAT